MNVTARDYATIWRSIAAALALTFLLFLLLLAYAPDSVAFSPNNYGWNGLHDVVTTYDLHPASSADTLAFVQDSGANETTILLEVQPVVPFSSLDALIIKNFVTSGGTLLIADNSGTSNSLLAQMGVGIRILSNYTVNDLVYNWKAPALPTAIVTPAERARFAYLSNVRGIAMDEPSPLSISRGVALLASSSPESFGANRSQLTSSQNPLQLLNGDVGAGLQRLTKGPFPVVAQQNLGNGSVIVFGDSQFFTNPVWNVGDNRVLTGNLFSHSQVYLDTSHWQANTAGEVKAELFSVYALIAQSPFEYLATAGIVAAVLLVLPVFSLSGFGEIKKKRDIVASSNLGPVLFNRELLERVRRDREKYGIR